VLDYDEDLNGHNDLRYDPPLSVLVGKQDPIGQNQLDPGMIKSIVICRCIFFVGNIYYGFSYIPAI